ncbi:MAG: TadE/TadG family type IV pilus assembly protein [Acidiferrobacterales bacterium]
MNPSRLIGRHSLLRGERGSVAVEFAILSPIIILVLWGLMLFGQMLYLHNNMLTAARDAVRSLAAAEISATQAETVVQNWLANWKVVSDSWWRFAKAA